MIDYQIFMRHADRICNSAHLNDNVERYRILKGIKHLENGDAIVTDSHRLYLARDIHTRTDGAVLTFAGKRLSGDYPDVMRVIPTADHAETHFIPLKDLLLAADSIFAVGSLIEELPKVNVVENMVKYDSIHVNYVQGLPVQFSTKLCLNAGYLLDAMKLFKAARCETITVEVHGSMRPVVFTNEDRSLLALILPIRKH